MAGQKQDLLRRVGLVAGVALLLGVMAAELALSALEQSQTFDEAVHVFAGYRYWKNFDFGVDPETPPFVKLLYTLPLLRLPLRVPVSLPDVDFKMVGYAAGRDFLYGNDAKAILWRARIAAVGLTLFLALAVFLVVCSMWGLGPAFLALILLVFEPNFLAHGALVTTDIAVTLGVFLGVSSFYFYLNKPTALRLVSAGVAAGVCLAIKHSGVLLLPMLIGLAVAELSPAVDPPNEKVFPRGARRASHLAASIVAIVAISIAVLWSMYGFRYAARPAGQVVTPSLPEFAKGISPLESSLVLQIARWHLLPESYLFGVVDISLAGTIPTVIFGKYYPSARWFYFPSVFIVKCTLGFLLLCCLALVSGTLREKQHRREVLFLVIPAAIYLFVAMCSGINYGIRHLLPIFPYLIILAAVGAWNLARSHRAFAGAVAALILMHAASSLHAFPNYIPYANELWGGPAKTHELLADSNVDWGQGLVQMKQYIDRHQIKNCWFAYFGSLISEVSSYGIPCKPLPTAFADLVQLPMPVVPAQVDGPVFLSATEVTRTFWRADWVNPYSSFQRMPPSALIADSILVYDGKVDLSQVSALTHEDLAMRLMNAKKLDDALAEAAAAVAVAPNRPIAHVTRSAVLAAMGRREEALEEMSKAESAAGAAVGAQ